MPTFSHQLAAYLVKHYDMNLANALIIIEEEWDFIEEQMVVCDCDVAMLARELVDIYMVA